MEWLSGVRKQAQDALSTALHSDAAERARALAAQASQQASVLAKEARNKAQVRRVHKYFAQTAVSVWTCEPQLPKCCSNATRTPATATATLLAATPAPFAQ